MPVACTFRFATLDSANQIGVTTTG